MLLCAQPSINKPPSHHTETTIMVQSNLWLLTSTFLFITGKESSALLILLTIMDKALPELMIHMLNCILNLIIFRYEQQRLHQWVPEWKALPTGNSNSSDFL